MTRLLLDTHVLLWALAEPGRLSKTFRSELNESRVFVSAASIWEVAIKAGLGKIAADPQEVLAASERAGFDALPVTGAHAVRVASLPGLHRDPFDRLLLAQAQAESMQLVTADRALLGYGAFVKMPPP